MPSSSEGIVGFLRARYTEARSREAGKRRVRSDFPFEFEWRRDFDREVVEVGHGPSGFSMPADDFWEQYGESAADPAVLADLDAKLRLIDWCEWPGGGPDSRYDYEWALAVLAVPFAAHADYDERWRP